MSPYYQDDWTTIYHADCRELLGALSAEVAITDPPYGVGLVQKYGNDHRKGSSRGRPSVRASVLYPDDPHEIKVMLEEVIPLLLRRVQRALIFPGTAMLWNYPEPAGLGAVWLPSGSGRSSWGYQCQQPILYYGPDPYLVDGKGARPNSFVATSALPERFDHPCPKHIAWMRWAVVRASRPGETVLDPFMGTGTTLRAAKDLGRRSIGIEVEERYCEIAAQRLQQEALALEGGDELLASQDTFQLEEVVAGG